MSAIFHKFFQLDNLEAKPSRKRGVSSKEKGGSKKSKVGCGNAPDVSTAETQTIHFKDDLALVQQHSSAVLTHGVKSPPVTSIMFTMRQIKSALQYLYGFSQFKIEEVAQAVYRVSNPMSYNLFLNLPTASGKSSVAEIATHLNPNQVTFFFAPTHALVAGYIARFMKHKFTFVVFKRGLNTDALRGCRVILCHWNDSNDSSLNEFMKTCQKAGILRVVVDEVHLAVMWYDWNDGAKRVTQLCKILQHPTLYLSATFPMWMQDSFVSDASLGFQQYRIECNFRQLSNVYYSIKQAKQGKLIDSLMTLVLQFLKVSGKVAKLIIFVRTRNEVDKIVKAINSYEETLIINPIGFKSEESTDYDLITETMAKFESGVHRCMVTTSISNQGLSFSNVQAVIILQVCLIQLKGSYNLLEYVQQIGRGGRGGEPVVSVWLTESSINNQIMDGMRRELQDGKISMKRLKDQQDVFDLLQSGGCLKDQIGKILGGFPNFNCCEIDAKGITCQSCSLINGVKNINPFSVIKYGTEKMVEVDYFDVLYPYVEEDFVGEGCSS